LTTARRGDQAGQGLLAAFSAHDAVVRGQPAMVDGLVRRYVTSGVPQVVAADRRRAAQQGYRTGMRAWTGSGIALWPYVPYGTQMFL